MNNSQNQKSLRYLIIPDTHNRCQVAENIIKFVKPDLTIFLGDYFDDFFDTPNIAADVAHWFKESVNKPDRIHLAGNHDVHYWFKDNVALRCSGYDQFKSIAINDIVERRDWEKLKFYYVLDGKWLLSHGGVHPVWIKSDSINNKEFAQSNLSEVVGKLKYDSIEAVRNFYANREHWFSYAGYTRSHSSRGYGGLLWCDWHGEFKPIRGIHQLVGHTPQRSLKWIVLVEGADQYGVLPIDDDMVQIPRLISETSYNLCLDSQPGLQYYAVYEDGLLKIHKTSDIK